MFTRQLVPTHSEGLPLQVPLAHNVPTEMLYHTGTSPTLNLPAEMTMMDPSDRLTWQWNYILGNSDYGPWGSSGPHATGGTGLYG